MFMSNTDPVWTPQFCIKRSEWVNTGLVEVPRINQTQAQNGNTTLITVKMTIVLRNALPQHTKTGINLNKQPKSSQYRAVQYLTELNKCELQSAHSFYKGVAGRKMQSASSNNCHIRTHN